LKINVFRRIVLDVLTPKEAHMKEIKHSVAGPNGLHKIPKEWTEIEEAAQALAVQYCPSWARMRVKLIVGGGYVVGYRWRGKLRVNVIPKTFGTTAYHGDCQVSGEWDGESLRRLQDIIDKARISGLKTFSEGSYVISLYRKGLVPLDLGKKHAEALKEQLGVATLSVRRDPEHARASLNMLRDWLAANGYYERLNGIIITPDGRQYDSTGNVTGTIGFKASDEEPE